MEETEMNYEERYKEALERMRHVVIEPENENMLQAIKETVFPELSESEDERIRKELIEFILWAEDRGMTRHDFHQRKRPGVWLAWLEKQKGQKPILEVFGFKVGDVVRLKNGDGRKHIIKSFEEVEGIHGPNFYHVEFEDNSARDGIYPGEEYPNGYYTQMEKFEEEQKPAEGREYSCADCGTTSGYTNDESEGDKRYREGIRYALQQTEDYTIGKTFKGLIPCWVNAPSKLHPAHKYHGKNVVIMHENNGGFRCVCIDDEKPVTFHLSEDTLFAEGWRKPKDRFEEAREKYQVEWSEADEKMLVAISKALGCDTAEKILVKEGVTLMMAAGFLESLRPQKLDASKLENFDPVDVLNRIKAEWPMAWEKVVGEQERSEEDEKWSDRDEEILEFVLGLLDNLVWRRDWEISQAECSEWLVKSLQPHWKPTEEQIHAIIEALKYLPNNKYEWMILNTLADVFRKLM